MRQKIIAVILLVVLLAFGFSGQLIPQDQAESAPNLAVTIWQESFETDGDLGVRYTSTEDCTDTFNDYFTRTDGTTINSTYSSLITGQDGSFYWAAQDTDGAPCTINQENIVFNAVDTSAHINLNFSVMVSVVQPAPGDGNYDHDDNAEAIFEYSTNGGSTYTPIVCFATDQTVAFNLPFLVDANCDGTGDGVELTEAMTTYAAAIPDAPSIIIRARMDFFDAGDEDFAFDNLQITGDLAGPLEPVINEFVVDHTGTDTDEFVEIYGEPSTDFSAYTIVEIEGDGASAGLIDDGTFTVGTTDANGYWTTPFQTNIWENGSVTLLLVEGYTGSLLTDIDTDNDGVIDNPQWTNIIDSVGTSDGTAGDFVYSTVDLAPNFDGTSFQPGGASRIPNGTDTDAVSDWRRNHFNGAGLPSFPLVDPVAGNAINTPNATNEYVTSLVINEIDYDQIGSPDAGEFIEVLNKDNLSVDLTSYSLDLINGADGLSYQTIPLSGTVTASDYFVVCGDNTNVANCDLDITPNTDLIQNGAPDAVALLYGTTIIDTVSYEGATAGYTETASAPDDSGVNADEGIARNPDGVDTDDNSVDFSICPISPGTDNSVCTPPPLVFIHDIQGSGTGVVNPGMTVTVQGIVVGDYQEDNQLDGFFIQEETADIDADPATSEGIFVYCGNNCPATYVDVAEGDLVSVTGVQEEFFNMSQLDVPQAGGSISIDTPAAGLGLVTPASIDLPVPGGFATVDLYYEQFEGMLVTFADVLTVTEHFQLFRYGEFMLSEGGKFTQYTQNGALPLNATDYNNHLDNVARRTIILDDLDNTQNSPLTNIVPVYHPQPNGFSTTTYVRGGATIPALTGVLHWSFAGQSGTDAWRIRPQITNPVSFTNPARPSTPTPGGNITVASFNVLNFFNGDGLGGGFPTSRGADSIAEFDRQTDKIVAAIIAMNADVVGLMEIENDLDDGNSAVEDLVDALNLVAGAGTYDFVASGVDGTDEIKVAIIYKPAVVAPAGAHQVLDTAAFTDPNTTGTPKNRPALAQTFQVIDSTNPDVGTAFTVIVLHLKSKGSSCGAPDDDTTTGQGNCNGTRTGGATELLNWLNTDPTGTGGNFGTADTDFLVIGDFNAYFQEDPMQVFYNASYSNTLTSGDYTYVFSGQWGSLDHGVSSSSMTTQVSGAGAWHINSDENALLDYNDTILDPSEASFHVKPTANPGLYDPNQFRASDHDAIVIGSNLEGTVRSNDLIVNATTFTGTANGEEISWATNSSTDPTLWCVANYVNSVWYSYTPTSDQYYTFSTTSLSGSLNPVLGVFSGTEGALNTLGCGTDAVTATTSVNLSGGQTYTIMVAHNGTSQIVTGAQFNLTSGSIGNNDAVVMFDPATSNTGLLDSVQNSPNEFAYVNTPPTSVNAEWVMGDWNADGVKTPGIFDNGAFRYTNDLGISANWSAGMWLGNAPGRVAVVAGRFDTGFTNDCIGWVDSNTSPVTGDLRFSLKWWCDMSASGAVALSAQWLAAPLGDSNGFVGTFQWVYGDWDSDTLDEPAVRRGSRIARSSNAPSEGSASYGSGAQRWDTADGDGPGAHGLDDGVFVAGDWDGNGQDTWGVVYDNGDFYYRDVLTWNPGPFEFALQTFTSGIATPRQADSHHAASGGSSAPSPAGPVVFRDSEDSNSVGGTVDTSRNVEANLAVSKAGNYTVGEVGLVGDSIIWTITLSNTGSAPANGVEITDNVPSELRVDDALANTGTITVRGQAVTFTVESIGVGETVQFQVVTTILQQPNTGTFANSVNVRVPDGNGGGSDANLIASGAVSSVDGLPATGYAPKFRW